MKFSKSVLLIIDNAIGQQLDTIDLAKSAKLAVELLQARRIVRDQLSLQTKPSNHVDDISAAQIIERGLTS
jgi:hypothetical protein